MEKEINREALLETLRLFVVQRKKAFQRQIDLREEGVRTSSPRWRQAHRDFVHAVGKFDGAVRFAYVLDIITFDELNMVSADLFDKLEAEFSEE